MCLDTSCCIVRHTVKYAVQSAPGACCVAELWCVRRGEGSEGGRMAGCGELRDGGCVGEDEQGQGQPVRGGVSISGELVRSLALRDTGFEVGWASISNWLHSGWCTDMLCTRSDHVACLECVFLRVQVLSCACLIGRAHLQPVG